MIREQPLETQEVSIGHVRLVVPTEEKLLRIKGVLVLKRNATRDFPTAFWKIPIKISQESNRKIRTKSCLAQPKPAQNQTLRIAGYFAETGEPLPEAMWESV